MNNFIPFSELEGTELDNTGGKGASLSKMYRFGLPVPNGFVVTAPFFRAFMDKTELTGKIKALLAKIPDDDLNDLERISANIRQMILEQPFPSEYVDELVGCYDDLGEVNTPVAVRSSSTAEDLDDASFAGQQETFLYVVGKEDLINKIKECWASLYNGRAIFYRKEKKFSEDAVSIAVVVQKMINSEKAGVMFTQNPITHNENELLIEAAWGLGEGVVSGIVTPDNYVYLRREKKAESTYISEKEVMVIRDPSLLGSVEVDVPKELKEKRVLSDEELLEMRNMAQRIEEFFEKPQDIEWAYEDDVLYLLQSRPITTL